MAQAESALEKLKTSPADADVAAADTAVAQAESSLASAVRQTETALASLRSAQNAHCNGFSVIPAICQRDSIPLSSESMDELNEVLATTVNESTVISAQIVPPLQSDAAHKNAADAEKAAASSLESAKARRAALDESPPRHELEQAITALASARARRAALDEGPAQHELDQAMASVESARKKRAALARIHRRRASG